MQRIQLLQKEPTATKHLTSQPWGPTKKTSQVQELRSVDTNLTTRQTVQPLDAIIKMLNFDKFREQNAKSETETA